jgi:prolyl-tRNA synthetase
MAKKGITPRGEDYSQWYLDIINQAKLADYAPVRGCMVIRPNGYAIWEAIQSELDRRFKDTGHVNAYFPLFIPESFMKKEAEHVEGFAPECAVVTEGGGSKLEEKLYVRPTSETIIYWRDLPLLINQWANIVRWEMRTRLFLRTLEFLWQEGHTAHATPEEAEEEARMILDLYAEFAENVLALSVVKGPKSDAEKFPGALRTYAIEAMMQDGKALQSGTSHNLSDHFAKAFEVQYQDKEGKLQFVHQTSWGVSTRLIGGVIMTHSDDDGLVLPPVVASRQVAIVPIWKNDEEQSAVCGAGSKLMEELKAAGVRVYLDDRDKYKPGFKFNQHEVEGVPLRVEIGPKDIAKNSVALKRRDGGDKMFVPMAEAVAKVKEQLDTMQKDLLAKSKKFREDHTKEIDSYDDFKEYMKSDSGWASSHWCGGADCETKVKDDTKATIRVIPFKETDTGKCIVCEKDSPKRVIFAKAY